MSYPYSSNLLFPDNIHTCIRMSHVAILLQLKKVGGKCGKGSTIL